FLLYKNMNPIYDPIVCLLGTPFSQCNTRDKTDILEQGKPTPSLSCLTSDKKGGKVFLDHLV
ncbi:zinc finger MYM-type protein 1-like, partial [Aphis craccivora]